MQLSALKILKVKLFVKEFCGRGYLPAGHELTISSSVPHTCHLLCANNDTKDDRELIWTFSDSCTILTQSSLADLLIQFTVHFCGRTTIQGDTHDLKIRFLNFNGQKSYLGVHLDSPVTGVVFISCIHTYCEQKFRVIVSRKYNSGFDVCTNVAMVVYKNLSPQQASNGLQEILIHTHDVRRRSISCKAKPKTY